MVSTCMQILIAVMVIGTIHFHSLNRLVSFEWNKNAFQYCYFMPVVIGILLWRRRKAFTAIHSRPSWFGLLPLGIGIFFLLLGEFGGEFLSLYLSIWFLILGLCWTALGWRKLRVILFPLVLILTVFPPPRFFYIRLIQPVQYLAAAVGAKVLQLLHIPVYRAGTVIELQFIRFEVTDLHSGLQFLIPIIIASLLFASVSNRWWKRSAIVICGAALAFGLNGIRVAGLALMANILRRDGIAPWMHDVAGWLMFVFGVGILWGIKRGLHKCGTQPELDRADLGQWEKRKQEGSTNPSHQKGGFSKQYATAVLMLAGAFLFLQYRGHTADRFPQIRSLDTFPTQIGSWQGERIFLDAEILRELDLSDYVQLDFTNGQGEGIDFYVAWYRSQAKGESIHSPETCLRGSGWRFVSSQAISVGISGGAGTPIRLNRTVLQNGTEQNLMYFWFQCRGRRLANMFELKLFNFWDKLIQRRTDGALVRVMTPVSPKETTVEAEQRLRAFLADVLPILDTYLPD
ncbi:MAG: VPLPA-CTERM-specific exosortase XrtD [Methanosarcinales archaeon]|nr:MAG: VPLPA-CTERM-specific exosortase XrtD [Methanosarcinales archaeon]